MSSSLSQRLAKFIYHKRLNKQQFAAALGYSSAEKINRLFRNPDAKPGYDILVDIANKFAELNIDWLLTGRGQMLRATYELFGHGTKSDVFVQEQRAPYEKRRKESGEEGGETGPGAPMVQEGDGLADINLKLSELIAWKDEVERRLKGKGI